MSTDLNLFVQKSIRTESIVDDIKTNPCLLTESVNIFISASHMLDQIKRQAYYGADLELPKILKAVGEISRSVDAIINEQDDFWSFPAKELKPHFDERKQVLDTRLIHGLIGVMTEAGELGEVLNAYIEDGKIDPVNIQEECFDVNWYQAIIHDALHLVWDDTLSMGVKKLEKRFPEKFSTDNAINRNTDLERTILEEEGSN